MSKGNYFKSSKAIFNVQCACKKTGLLLLPCNIKHLHMEKEEVYKQISFRGLQIL